MALSPVAFIAPNYRDYKNYWLKAYEPGTTTAKAMYLEATGDTSVAKLQINKDGFIKTAGEALVIPYIDGAYDAYIFPTEAEADTNDTTNAERVADDITGVNGLSNYIASKTLQEAVENTSAKEGDVVMISDRDNGIFEYMTGQTDNGYNIVACEGVIGLSLVLRVSSVVTPTMWGLKGDGSNEITGLQSLFFSDYRDRITGRGSFKIESSLELRSGTRVVGSDYRRFKIYTDEDRNINLVIPENKGNTTGDITTDIWLENMEFDHNRVTDFTSETLMTLLILCMKRVRIINCEITNPNTDGMYISDTYGGWGDASNQPEDIQVIDINCTGDFHNRNGISVVSGNNITLRDHIYTNITRNDMPGAIDLEPNDSTQLVSNVLIENITCNNCKQGIVTYFGQTDSSDYVKDITIRNILINGTPTQDESEKPYSEFVASNSTVGVALSYCSGVTIEGITVNSANSCSVTMDAVTNASLESITVSDARTHGIVFRDCTNIKLSDFDVECVNGEFNSVKTKGLYLTYDEPGVDHVGVRTTTISSGRVDLTDPAVSDTFGLAGIGNIKDLSMTDVAFEGEWSDAVLESDGSSGWPDNWGMNYSIEDGFSGTPAKFSFTEGQTVNRKWSVPGYTSGKVSISSNTDQFISTPFRVNASSVASCSLLTANSEPASINAGTAGNFQVAFPSSTTADVFWELEAP